jgi:outer membrane lipoprotein carrier protein
MFHLAFSLLLAVSTSALAHDASAVIEKIEARYSEVRVIEAKFLQKTSSSLYGEDIQKGSVTLKRPMKMRWDFGDKEWIMNGDKLWIYTIADKQVLEFDTSKGPVNPMYSLLGSLDQLGALFDVTIVDSDETVHVLDLTPKGQAEFKKIQLTLTADLRLKKIRVINPMGDPVELSFSEVQLGGDAPDAQFDFTAPAGVEVIRMGL